MPQWEDVRPILVAAYEAMEDTPDGSTSGAAVADAIGADHDDVQLWRILRDLHADEYLNVRYGAPGGLPAVVRGTTDGRQGVLGWPGPRTADGHAELLVTLLRAQADAADTLPEHRSKLRAVLDALGHGGTDALSKVTADLILRAGGTVT